MYHSSLLKGKIWLEIALIDLCGVHRWLMWGWFEGWGLYPVTQARLLLVMVSHMQNRSCISRNMQ